MSLAIRILKYWPVVVFAVIVIGVGLEMATLLPSLKMLGMRSSTLLDLGNHISRYVGGISIAMLFGGVASCLGLLLRLLVVRIRTGNFPEKERCEAWIAGLCGALGIIPLIWYFASWVTP
jgi:hypothetical protein